MRVSPTLEDYLEAVHRLAAERGLARVRDISQMLSVHKSTVTAALRSLSDKGMVDYAPYELPTLTAAGERVAKDVRRRHRVLARFLTEVLSVDAGVAEANACRLEHAIDAAVLERLLVFIEFVERCPRGGLDWLRTFDTFCQGRGQERCRECVEGCLRSLDASADRRGRSKTSRSRPGSAPVAGGRSARSDRSKRGGSRT